jgi:hypothetical protein
MNNIIPIRSTIKTRMSEVETLRQKLDTALKWQDSFWNKFEQTNCEYCFNMMNLWAAWEMEIQQRMIAGRLL